MAVNDTRAPCASVIILTYNGLPRLRQCLASVLAQDAPWPFEVLAIDSGSTDGTWEFLTEQPIRRLQIPKTAFNHGSTRNLGAETARGEYLVYLVQDAVPADPSWLHHLVAAIEITGAAGSYGRELPWPGDNPLIRLQMELALPQERERQVQYLPPGESWQDLRPEKRLALASFHNTSSCIRRAVWVEHPFGPLKFGEDLDWGARVIQVGYRLVYEPAATVYHSHDRPVGYEMKRAYADHELVARLLAYQAYPTWRKLARSWLWATSRYARAIWRERCPVAEKLGLLLRTPLVIGARCSGAYLGARAPRLAKSGWWKPIDRRLRQGV